MSNVINLQGYIQKRQVLSRAFEYQGDSHSAHFLELSASDAEDLFLDLGGEEGQKKGLRAKVIAAIVCDEQGNSVLSEEDAGKLPNALATKLQELALEANGVGAGDKDAPEKS